MTRSRKKTPCCHIVKKDTWFKGHYNRKLRRAPIDFAEGVSSIPDGMAYRKANESWEIADWKDVGRTYGEYDPWRECSEEERRNSYERWYIRK